ncbi:MAG: hypothetical protein H6746_08340 [Deltaproteobacteria bacterium]|nr:hypothetical protein [Deltaproteobacteria bacterium]
MPPTLPSGTRLGRSVLLSALAAALVGCGAQDVDAPVTVSTDRCPSVDELIPGLRGLLDDGALEHLQSVLGQDLSDAARADLVRTAVDLVASFPPGSVAGLGEIGDSLDVDGRLQAFGARLMRWLVAEGPGSPYAETLASARRLLSRCEGPPALRLVRRLLADDELLAAVRALPAALDVPSLVSGLEVDGQTGRPALRALLRNLLLAATSPDFTIEAWLDLLSLAVDVDAPPLGPVLTGARRLLDDTDTRAALRGLSACVLAADPTLSLGDLLFDASTDDALDLVGALDLIDPSRGTLLPEPVRVLIDASLAFLEVDAFGRRSLVVALEGLLAPDAAPQVLGDVGNLLDARVLGEITRVLAALATRSCAQ